MSDVSTWAVIPSRSRPRELTELVERLELDHVHLVIVDNGYDERPDVFDLAEAIVRYDEWPPNLYRMWNLGLDAIDETRHSKKTEWNVIMLNDDAVLPDGWVRVVTRALREYDVVAACTDTYGAVRTPTVSRGRDTNLFRRMCPWAFALRGEVGLRADESFRWWYGDTDLDWQIRESGGLVMIPGFKVDNLHANSTTVGELAVQAGRDRETFARKWGTVPW